MKTHHHINLHPNHYATQLLEQAQFKADQIHIYGDVQVAAAQLTAIQKVKTFKRGQEIHIKTKETSEQKKELWQELADDQAWQALVEAMEVSMNQFRTAVLLKERKHTLGTDAIYHHFVSLPTFLKAHYCSVMAYYAPWQAHIQGDLQLTAQCFSSILGYPVQIEHTAARQETITGVRVSKWVLGAKDEVGGKSSRDSPCVRIVIGEVTMKDLAQFVPDSANRRFLEEVLFPFFLPEAWDWETKIIVAEKKSNFFVDVHNEINLVGTNSYVSAE